MLLVGNTCTHACYAGQNEKLTQIKIIALPQTRETAVVAALVAAVEGVPHC